MSQGTSYGPYAHPGVLQEGLKTRISIPFEVSVVGNGCQDRDFVECDFGLALDIHSGIESARNRHG
jgi:hypothetical protein